MAWTRSKHRVGTSMLQHCCFLALHFMLDMDSGGTGLPLTTASFFLIAVLLGILVAHRRSTLHGTQPSWLMYVAGALWATAVVFIGVGSALSHPMWSVLAFGVILAGWGVVRNRGVPFMHSLSLGMLTLVPMVLDAFDYLGGFKWLELTTVSVTSILANSAGMPNAQVGGTLLFSHGVADQFSCIGSLGSSVSFIGMAFFCTLAYQSRLLPAISTLVLSVVIWTALRSFAWVALCYIGNRNETWYPWSTAL